MRNGKLHSRVITEDKDTGKTVAVAEDNNHQFETQIPVGDGCAKTGASAILRRGIDYNSLTIGMEAWVEITCNQDPVSISRSQRLASDLAQFEIERLEERFDSRFDIVAIRYGKGELL